MSICIKHILYCYLLRYFYNIGLPLSRILVFACIHWMIVTVYCGSVTDTFIKARQFFSKCTGQIVLWEDANLFFSRYRCLSSGHVGRQLKDHCLLILQTIVGAQYGNAFQLGYTKVRIDTSHALSYFRLFWVNLLGRGKRCFFFKHSSAHLTVNATPTISLSSVLALILFKLFLMFGEFILPPNFKIITRDYAILFLIKRRCGREGQDLYVR